MKTKPTTPTTTTTTVGIDLGDRKHAICALDHDGNILKQYSIPYTRAIRVRYGVVLNHISVIRPVSTSSHIAQGQAL